MNAEHPDLAALLRGELTNAEAVDAAAHAKECATCPSDLVGLALGHGLLRAARRSETFTLPTHGLHDPATHADRRAASTGVDTAVDGSVDLVHDLQRSRRRWCLAALAASVVVLVLTIAGASLVAVRQQAVSPREATTASASLRALSGTATGEVRMDAGAATTRVHIETPDLQQVPADEFYYAWLLDPSTNKMLPLGQVRPGYEATFDLPTPLMAQYSAVDISLEDDDGNPAHSPVSVLRGTLPKAAPAPKPGEPTTS